MTTKLTYNHKHTTYSQAYATWPSNENWTSEKRPAVTWQFYSHHHQRYIQQNGNINRKDTVQSSIGYIKHFIVPNFFNKQTTRPFSKRLLASHK